ncbi:MAG: hypothetical protein R2852_06290 [Bacteroidia bacterium]
MKHLKNLLISAFLFFAHSTFAQQFELGMGVVKPIGLTYGLNIHTFGGYTFNDKFVLGLSVDYSKLLNTKIKHDRLIDGGTWNRPKQFKDTFYDVHEKNEYSFFDIALEPRFYLTGLKSRFFFSPSIGVGLFRQKNSFTKVNSEYEELGIFTAFNPSFGIEFGKEYALNKSKQLHIQIDFSSKFYLGFKATDIYLAPFTQSKIIVKGRLGLVWRI